MTTIEMSDIYSRVHYAIRQETDACKRVWYPDELTAIREGKESNLYTWRVYYLPEYGYTVTDDKHDMVEARLCIRYKWCDGRYRQTI
jgi:hypothetical protein